MKEFFAMGGYAFFVWTSYAVVAFLMIASVIMAQIKRKKIIKQMQQLAEES